MRESVHRVAQMPAVSHPVTDTIDGDLTVTATGEERTNIVFNGQPWNLAYSAIPGPKWRGGDAELLAGLFALECGVKFYGQGTAAVDGRPARVYEFEAPAESCAGSLRAGEQRIYPAFDGKLWIDDATKLVLRCQRQTAYTFKRLTVESEVTSHEANGILMGAFPLHSTSDDISWKFTQLESFRVPLESEAHQVIQPVRGFPSSVDRAYANYQLAAHGKPTDVRRQ